MSCKHIIIIPWQGPQEHKFGHLATTKTPPLTTYPSLKKAWMPFFFSGGGISCGHPEESLQFVGDHLHQAKFLDLPPVTDEQLHKVAAAEQAWNEIKALSLAWLLCVQMLTSQWFPTLKDNGSRPGFPDWCLVFHSSNLNVFIAHVVKSFDTVDRDILGRFISPWDNPFCHKLWDSKKNWNGVP